MPIWNQKVNISNHKKINYTIVVNRIIYIYDFFYLRFYIKVLNLDCGTCTQIHPFTWGIVKVKLIIIDNKKIFAIGCTSVTNIAKLMLMIICHEYTF